VIPADEVVDADQDGFVVCEECDDSHAETFPGAVEICDRQDNDCDGVIPADEVVDEDGDGFVQCEDCDDLSADTFPGALELCDRQDNDCDGVLPLDESEDADGDGFVQCEECDDASGLVFPGAAELCNGEDDNCDGQVDEGVNVDNDLASPRVRATATTPMARSFPGLWRPVTFWMRTAMASRMTRSGRMADTSSRNTVGAASTTAAPMSSTRRRRSAIWTRSFRAVDTSAMWAG
jgi:hypothetical protein